MSHVREQLRKAVATAITGLTTTGSRVYSNRVYQLNDSDLPCLMVMSGGDEVEALSMHHPYQQRRRTNIRIEATVKGKTGYDDTLDTICMEVEESISNASSSLVKGMYIEQTGIEFDGSGEQPIARAIMIFYKDLYTESNNVDTAL